MAGIIAAMGQAGIGGGGNFAKKITSRLLGDNPALRAAQAARAAKARQAARVAGPQAPSVVQTAGATNMGQRINTIESRLQALEGSGVSAGPAQPVAGAAQPIAEVAPQQTQTDVNISNQPQAVMNSVIPTAQPQAAASEELGSLMASPFTMRQRENMGPLNLNSPLNGNAFAKAVQDAKATGASKFEVGGKTYNVK